MKKYAHSFKLPSLAEIAMGFSYLLWPAKCQVCGTVLAPNDNNYVCIECIAKLPRTGYEKRKNNPVYERLINRTKLHSVFSGFYFRKGETVRKLIHAFKYLGHDEVGELMGEMLGHMMLKTNWHKDYEYVVPIPMHPRKLKQRGYNQTSKIAKGIAKITGLTVREDIIIRVIEGTTQTKKNALERWNDIQHHYVCEHPERIKGARILLVDDVMTTGATIEACSNILNEIEGVRVGAVTVAVVAR